MIVIFTQHNEEPVAINTDHIISVEVNKIHTDVVSIQTTARHGDGRNKVYSVQGRLEEIIEKLNE